MNEVSPNHFEKKHTVAKDKPILGQHETKIQHRLKSQRLSLEAISPAIKNRMWKLFETFYSDVNEGTFYRDLGAKDGAIILFDEEKNVKGFSTYVFYQHAINNQVVDVLFSGDTIIHPDHWGQNVLHLEFFKLVVQRKLANPWRKVYWFLISKGFKTYLLMANNFPQSWPRYNMQTPDNIAMLINSMANRLYPANWCQKTGLLEFAESEGSLKKSIAPIGDKERANPNIAYFETRNPKHAQGTELCCLAEISWEFIGIQIVKQANKSSKFYLSRLAKLMR